MKKLIANGVLMAASALVAGLLVIALIDAVVMPYIVDVPSVQIPRLQTLDAAQAERRLEQWGLQMVVGDSMFNERITQGAVIDHVPEPGQRVKRGRAVTVQLSKGPRYYSTPKLRGVSLREAQLQLESNQLQMGSILYVSSTDIPEKAVIDQDPVAGTTLARGGTVSLRISSGPPSSPKTVPNLTNLLIDTAEDTLTKYEMLLGRIETQIDNRIPPGTILSQIPAPGEKMPRNTRISLRVSAQTTNRGDR